MSAPAALPLSKLRVHQGLAFLSGELPLLPEGGVPEGIEAQAELTLQRISATLAGIGLELADVVNVLVHLTDAADFAGFNAVYARHFSAPYPTRTTVVAALVLPGARLEITVTAALKS